MPNLGRASLRHIQEYQTSNGRRGSNINQPSQSNSLDPDPQMYTRHFNRSIIPGTEPTSLFSHRTFPPYKLSMNIRCDIDIEVPQLKIIWPLKSFLSQHTNTDEFLRIVLGCLSFSCFCCCFLHRQLSDRFRSKELP